MTRGNGQTGMGGFFDVFEVGNRRGNGFWQWEDGGLVMCYFLRL